MSDQPRHQRSNPHRLSADGAGRALHLRVSPGALMLYLLLQAMSPSCSRPTTSSRLKRALRMDSSEFLEKHTITGVAAEPNFPVVLLKMAGRGQALPLGGRAGLHRLSEQALGMPHVPFGRGRAAEPQPRGPRVSLPGPRGPLPRPRAGRRTARSREWVSDQGIEEYDMMGSSFKGN